MTRDDFPKSAYYTEGGASLYVGGIVDNDEDKNELKRIVTESHPPVYVLYNFHTKVQIAEWKTARKADAKSNAAPASQ